MQTIQICPSCKKQTLAEGRAWCTGHKRPVPCRVIAMQDTTRRPVERQLRQKQAASLHSVRQLALRQLIEATTS